MNKKLFVLPLLALLITGCKGENEQPSNNPSESQTSQSENPSSQSSSQDVDITHAGTQADPFTAEEAIAKMAAAGDGVIVDNKEYYVTGTFDAGTTVNSQYHQWYGMLDGTDFKISGATNDSGKTINEVDGGMDGRTVIVKGYLELYQGEYKVGYLPASASPTGNKYVPSLVSVSGESDNGGGGQETGGGIAGENASETGTVPSEAQTISFDFTSGSISGITATSSSSPNASGVATVNGYEFNYAHAIAHAASDYIETGYLGLCAKGGKAKSSFANKTPIPGKIVKVEFTMPVEKSSGSVSALAPFVIDFGTTALGTTTGTTGATGGSGATLSAYSTIEGSYFAISVVQGVSSKGEATWYNGYIATMTVTYVA